MCRDITKEINFDEIPSGYIVGGKGGTPPRVWGRVLHPTIRNYQIVQPTDRATLRKFRIVQNRGK